jgi:dTDP-4-amino-4,6-dideoxygalactose transaminase
MAMTTNTIEKLTNPNKSIEFHKPTLTKEELQTVLDCLVDDLMSSGCIVEKFEKDFKSTFGLRNVISANSLFSAYHLALQALEIQAGDNILLSTFAPLPAFHSVLLLRANPIPVDLGKNSFHMDIESFQKKLEKYKPKAVLVDHTFGCLLDIKNYNTGEVPVVEDYSEALGADSETISVGRQGIISICGLATNHVITTGNGALVVTSLDNFAENIRSLKYSYTNSSKKKLPILRYDYNLLDFQAAMGIEQISKLGVIIERKKKIAQVYLQAVLSTSHETYFKKASEDQFNRFPIVISKPFDEVDRYFKSLLIGTDRTIQEPIHRILELPNADFPNAERLFQRGHLIPIYPNLTKDNVSRIANSIKGLY